MLTITRQHKAGAVTDLDLDQPFTDYFTQRSRVLVEQGVDPDDDDAWAQPDNDS